MTIREEFGSRVSFLRNLHFQEASGRVKSLIEWMESQPPIRDVLAVVRRKADGLAIIHRAGRQKPPPANTPDEIAAVGLVLMEACRKHPLPTICLSWGIGPTYGTRAVQPYVDAALERYIYPLLVHVGRELDRADADYLPARVADHRFDELLLGRNFAECFPVTHQHLSRIASEFSRGDAACQNIGNSCRQAMIEFCRECCEVLHVQLRDEMKRGDVKAITRELIPAIYRGERFAVAQERLVASVWDCAQSLTHRVGTTREEALRVYLWTGLTIEEIATLATRQGGEGVGSA